MRGHFASRAVCKWTFQAIYDCIIINYQTRELCEFVMPEGIYVYICIHPLFVMTAVDAAQINTALGQAS